MAKIRSQVLDLLGEAPWLLEQVEAFARFYPNDPKLIERLTSVYTALLTTIMASLRWYEHGVCMSCTQRKAAARGVVADKRQGIT
jgi:hypothetical protein